jgi:hypothetical protein
MSRNKKGELNCNQEQRRKLSLDWTGVEKVSRPEERPDEAEAAEQEAADWAAPAAAGFLPRRRRHLQVRVRRMLHQRVPDHAYVPAAAVYAAAVRGGPRRRRVLRRGQDVAEAGVPGAVGDLDHRWRRPPRHLLLGRAPVPQLEVAGRRAVAERRAGTNTTRPRRRLGHDSWNRRHGRSDRNTATGGRRRRLGSGRGGRAQEDEGFLLFLFCTGVIYSGGVLKKNRGLAGRAHMPWTEEFAVWKNQQCGVAG